ncbi:MAG: CRISPR-associated endonuclease Cas1, partial [Tepidisphaeraceae bacterium]
MPTPVLFMEVEGIHLPSADTEQGVAVHKRVDRASAERAEDDPAKPHVARSLTLTSKLLGLTATLDLAEINGKTAIPVEYRKGRPKRTESPAPDDPGEDEPPAPTVEPWPTDRIQVGLQALLLEEAGFTVPEAIIYYAAVKQRLRVPVDAAMRTEALKTLRDAQAAARGPRPLPLINDSRCVRCSLQPICLPDEINQQRFVAEALSPRKIWPPRDESIHVVAQQEGTRIGIKGMALKVTDKDGRVTREVPLANLESLALLGGIQISTQAVHALSDRGIPIGYLSSAGRLVAMIDPLDSVSAAIRKAQVRACDDPGRCLELAKAIVAAKIINQRVLLQRNHRGLPDLVLEDLLAEADRARAATGIDVVRGHVPPVPVLLPAMTTLPSDCNARCSPRSSVPPKSSVWNPSVLNVVSNEPSALKRATKHVPARDAANDDLSVAVDDDAEPLEVGQPAEVGLDLAVGAERRVLRPVRVVAAEDQVAAARADDDDL